MAHCYSETSASCPLSLRSVATRDVCHSHPVQHCLPLQILGALHAIHAVAVFFKLMSPALYSPGAGRRGRGMYTLVILNSLNLAVACRYDRLLHSVVCICFSGYKGGAHENLQASATQMHPVQ